MSTKEERAHGTTPGLQLVNAGRTADKQAAFLLPYLKPGMSLLDCGSGPGTITVGLAEGVAPGEVVGVDHDQENVRIATALAVERGVGNLSFRVADAVSLPFEDATFDAAFENNLFCHLSDPVAAAREIGRVLKPGGLIAVRDTDTDIGLHFSSSPFHAEMMRLFREWQTGRGSDMRFGKRLVSIVLEAGFTDLAVSVSADVHSPTSSAEIRVGLLRGEFGSSLVESGAVDRPGLDAMINAAVQEGKRPDSFHANVHVEVIGRKL